MSAEHDEDRQRPPVMMTGRDWKRLKRLSDRAAALYHPVSGLLAKELRRAIVCSHEEIPPDVVTMNSRVVFRTQGRSELESRVLVFPERYTPNGFCVSVTAPLGAALIGLRSGSGFHYRSPTGDAMHVFVQDVAYQPEAAARERLSRGVAETAATPPFVPLRPLC